MEYWDYTDNMNAKEGYKELPKMKVELIPMTNALAHQIFRDYENDKCLFGNGEFVPYVYDEEQINHYCEDAASKGKMNYAILWNDIPVGEVRFKNFKDSTAEIGITLKKDIYKNKGIGTKAIGIACSIAKEELKLSLLTANILEDNSRSQMVFLKNQFEFRMKMGDFLVFERNLY